MKTMFKVIQWYTNIDDGFYDTKEVTKYAK